MYTVFFVFSFSFFTFFFSIINQISNQYHMETNSKLAHDTKLVYGYTRLYIYLNINDIILLILSYFHIAEQFIKSGISLKIYKGITIFRKQNAHDLFLQNNAWLSHISDEFDTESEVSSVYGECDIVTSNDFYQWTLQLGPAIYSQLLNDTGTGSYNDILIGITNTKDVFLNEYLGYFTDTRSTMTAYAVSGRGSKFTMELGVSGSSSVNESHSKSNSIWKDNDIIQMILNIRENSLKFYRNKSLITIFDNIIIDPKDTFKMIISISGFDKLQTSNLEEEYIIMSLVDYKCVRNVK